MGVCVSVYSVRRSLEVFSNLKAQTHAPVLPEMPRPDSIVLDNILCFHEFIRGYTGIGAVCLIEGD